MHERDGADVEIIRLLKSSPKAFVSGEVLRRALGVSRSAVWKHVQGLRKAGYTIEAGPRLGYRLDLSSLPFNGVELASRLKTDFVGRRICFLEAVDSTNLRAFELARLREPEGTVVVADSQSMGKGRLRRHWASPPGVNLYTSILLRPAVLPRDAQKLTLLMAVAVAETITAFLGRRPSVKWPNDILVGSRKLAGILMEMESEADRVRFVVAGVGVNINMPMSLVDEGLRPAATSIMEETGKKTSRAEFTTVLYSCVEKWYNIVSEAGFDSGGFIPVMDAWRGYFVSEGKPVRVRSFGRTIEGICEGIDTDGALLVRRPSGKTERVISGDVESSS